MALVTNTNIASLIAGRGLQHSQSLQQTGIQRLSSGLRINSAADDAAGLAIAMRFAAQIAGSDQAYRNVNDGVSLTQVAEGASTEISGMLQRMRQLAVQSANGTLNDSDRSSLQNEFDQLRSEIDRVTGSAQFNGVSLLNGSSSLDFQVGPDAGDTVSVSTADLSGGLSGAGLGAADISTAAGASSAIGTLDAGIELVSGTRSDFAAAGNRFESAARNLQNVSENESAAKSRIMDADYAKETASYSAGLIGGQAGVAMSAQANASTRQVLSLLS